MSWPAISNRNSINVIIRTSRAHNLLDELEHIPNSVSPIRLTHALIG